MYGVLLVSVLFCGLGFCFVLFGDAVLWPVFIGCDCRGLNLKM